MGEDGGDGEAAGALDVHEEGARSRHKGLICISCPIHVSLPLDMSGGSYLELVLTGLGLRRRVEEVDRENLSTFNVRSHSHDSYDSFGMFIVLGMIFFSIPGGGGGEMVVLDAGGGAGDNRGIVTPKPRTKSTVHESNNPSQSIDLRERKATYHLDGTKSRSAWVVE